MTDIQYRISYIGNYPVLTHSLSCEDYTSLGCGGGVHCATVSTASEKGADIVHMWYKYHHSTAITATDVVMITHTKSEDPNRTHVYPDTRSFPLIDLWLGTKPTN